MITNKSIKNKLLDIIIFIILFVLFLSCVYPIVYCVAVSFSSAAAAEAGKVFLLPVGFTLKAYRKIMGDMGFLRAFIVSVCRVVVGGGLNMFFVLTMAYPLSKPKIAFKQRNLYMWLLVFTMLFNAGLIPWYLAIKNYQLLNTFWALVIPGAVPVYNLILMMNFFKGIPHELEEAALIDGAGPLTILGRIFLPISKPGIATIALFCIVAHWNNYFDGLVLINNPNLLPLQTYVQQFNVSRSLTQNLTSEQLKNLMETSSTTIRSAKIMITMLPILMVYPFLQRYFTNGLVLGAVKG